MKIRKPNNITSGSFKKASEDMMSASLNPNIRNVYKKVFNPKGSEEVRSDFSIGENELFVGFKSPNFTPNNIVVIPVDFVGQFGEHKSKIMTIVGIQGSGKTNLMKTIADQIVQIHGYHRLKIDPYGEGFIEKHPFAYNRPLSYRVFINNFLKPFNLQTHGYRAIVITPKYISMQAKVPNVDKRYAFMYSDFKNMALYEVNTAMSILSDLLDIEGNSANINLLITIMNDNTINSWADLYKALERAVKRVGKDNKGTQRVSIIFGSLRARISMGVFSDDEADSINICQLLALYEEVIFKGALREVVDDDYMARIYNGFVKFILASVRIELKRLLEGATDTYLKNDIVIDADEADSLAPAKGNCSLTEPYVQTASKQRKTGITELNAVQSASKLNEVLLDQSNYIFVFKLNDSNASALRKRGVSEEIISRGYRLKVGVKTNVGTTVSECMCIDSEGRLVAIFYPIFPMSAFIETGRQTSLSSMA